MALSIYEPIQQNSKVTHAALPHSGKNSGNSSERNHRLKINQSHIASNKPIFQAVEPIRRNNTMVEIPIDQRNSVNTNEVVECGLPYTVVDSTDMILKQYTSPNDAELKRDTVLYNSLENYKKLCAIKKQKQELTQTYSEVKKKNGLKLIDDPNFLCTMFIRCIQDKYSQEERDKRVPKIDKQIVECFIDITNTSLFASITRESENPIYLNNRQVGSWLLRESSIIDSVDETCSARVFSYLNGIITIDKNAKEVIPKILVPIIYVKGLGYIRPLKANSKQQLPSINMSVMNSYFDMFESNIAIYPTFIDLILFLKSVLTFNSSLWIPNESNFEILNPNDLKFIYSKHNITITGDISSIDKVTVGTYGTVATQPAYASLPPPAATMGLQHFAYAAPQAASSSVYAPLANYEEKNDHGPAIRGLPQESVGVPQHVIKLNNKQVKVPSTDFLKSLSKEYVDPDIMIKICGLDINDRSTLDSSLYQRVFNINRNNSHLAYPYPERYYFKLNNITRKQNEYTYKIDDVTFSTSTENFNQLIKDGLIFRKKTKEELKKWYNFSGGDKKTKKHKRSIYGKHSKKHVRRAKKRTHHKTKHHRK